MKHKLTFIRTTGLLNCFSLLTIQLLDKDSDNIELMFMDFSVGLFQILCFVQYILGV